MRAKYRRELATPHYRVFLGALAVMVLHLWEDAFVHKENGDSLGAQLGSAAAAVVVAGVAAALYPVLWRRVRPLLVLAFGAFTVLAGWQGHVSNAIDEGPSGGDYTGILFTLAGLVMIGLGLLLAADSLRARAAPAAR